MLKTILVIPVLLFFFTGPKPAENPHEKYGEPARKNLTPEVHRWGRDGHKIVCEIAYREVSSQTRRAIDHLLDEDDDYDSFPESCLWADVIRREARYSKYPTAHYMNIPRGAAQVSAEEHCQTTYCVVEAIEDMSSVLASPRFNSREKLEALKFLTHFIGDLHQPLHAGYGDDRGGNDTAVTAWGESRNLHSVWDWVLIERTGVPWHSYAARLANEITPIDRRLWASGMPIDWAEESYQIVENAVYETGEDAVVGDKYFERNIATVEQQLKKAAVRTAMVLDRLLGE